MQILKCASADELIKKERIPLSGRKREKAQTGGYKLQITVHA